MSPATAAYCLELGCQRIWTVRVDMSPLGIALDWRGQGLHGNGLPVYTLQHFKWMTSKDLLYSMWNSAHCDVAAWMGEEFGGEWIHVYV